MSDLIVYPQVIASRVSSPSYALWEEEDDTVGSGSFILTGLTTREDSSVFLASLKLTSMANGLSLLGPSDTNENKVVMEREDMVTLEDSSTGAHKL